MASVLPLLRRLWLLFAQTLTVALALLAALALWRPALWQSAAGPFASAARLPGPSWNAAAGHASAGAAAWPASAATAAGALPGTSSVPAHGTDTRWGFASAVQRAAPAVVSIAAARLAPRRAGAEPGARNAAGEGRGPGLLTGLGSGVLVSSQGDVLTNAHVVDGADDIEITLADGRSAAATLVGTDPDSDLALLRIGLGKLPAIAFGSMDEVQIGDPVLAIGNPFNVGQTATSGIVSALDRHQLGLAEIESYIQTDAAINPGSSGGALVDTQGRLVGINTAIFSRSGGSMGIGFAIPIDIAREVLDGLRRDGRMVRGWIGVQPRDLTPEFADSFQLPVHAGVLVTGVRRDGPGARAGLRPGDVVTAVNGRPVTNTSQLLRAIGAVPPVSTASLAVQRGEQALRMTVTVAQRPAAADGRAAEP